MKAHFASACFVLLATAPAQFAGYRDSAFPNTSGQGTPSLTARVYYPATAAGANAPLLPRIGGYPVIVYLHGFSALGSWYGLTGSHLATHGYVAVLLDTAQFSSGPQRADGIAAYAALQTANQQPGHFLQGALDMTRAGVSGHSMGGGNTVAVLAANPGYAAGLCFAPVYQGSAVTNRVAVPLGVIHGQGDTTLPWQANGLATFSAAHNYVGVKFLYLFDASGDHLNVVGFSSSPVGLAIWARSARIMTGFFDRYLNGTPGGLEEVVGQTALAEPELAQLLVEVEHPELWSVGNIAIGQAPRLEVLGEPGPAALLAAAARASIATPFGVLELDPATLAVLSQGTTSTARLFTTSLSIPNDPALVGAQVPLQGIGLDRLGNLRLTGLLPLQIQ